MVFKRRPLKQNKKKDVLLRSRGYCQKIGCGNSLKDGFEIHHIVPVELGGTNEINNLVAICKKCHNEISQGYQRLKVKIDQIEKLLRQKPFMDSYRRKKDEYYLEKLKGELKLYFEGFKFTGAGEVEALAFK